MNYSQSRDIQLGFRGMLALLPAHSPSCTRGSSVFPTLSHTSCHFSPCTWPAWRSLARPKAAEIRFDISAPVPAARPCAGSVRAGVLWRR